MTQPSLFDRAPDDERAPADRGAREFALDPRNDVVLEASAGTGKTSVLVGRYVRLIEAGVAPRHILAITFTRKAAAEMRDRVLAELRRRGEDGRLPKARWQALRHRLPEIQISTIDAFCFGLLREFPLEADVDPAFDIADETDMARFADEALDLTLRAARALVPGDEHVMLLLARAKLPVLRAALAGLLDRRQIALPAVRTFVRTRAPRESAAAAAVAFVDRIRRALTPPHVAALLDDGPLGSPGFRWLHHDLTANDAALDAGDPARVLQFRRRLERHFLTRSGTARRRLDSALTPDRFASPAARRRHEQAVQALAPAIADALAALDDDVNGLLSRGLLRVLAIAVDRYERLLDEHALLDFAGMLGRSVRLLSRQEEFARSRLKLQSRYHHVLVDEFQDTSRLQWQLIERLIDAWGEGEGVTDAPTSIFIVGDRKQSIYRFRHAEVTLLDDAARRIAALRPGRRVRQAIRTSFRAVPELLAFVNALSGALQSASAIAERFSYGEADEFPVPDVGPGALRDGAPVLGVVAAPSMPATAAAVASEVERLLAGAVVRDRRGPPRPARPDDIAILFRARAGHQYFEDALEARGIRTYVYKGLGFFDAPEVQDLQALLRYLAQPESDLRAAELLRSRIVRLSDAALVQLAPSFARAILDARAELPALDEVDGRLLAALRASAPAWLALADRVTPSELIDRVLRETVYAVEMRGRRAAQARENVKKLRSLVRRVESRGYATLGRLARYFDTLRTGDESNAIVEAAGCVNLMTIHAAKGLEFPIVFVVNLHVPGRGRPAGFSVVERGPDGQPAVAFGATPATVLEDERDAEELRRLLYVAVTRARDRLYLAGEVDGQTRLRRGTRSLAALLPDSLGGIFSAAAGDAEATGVTWESGRGSFTFAVCRAAPDTSAPAAAAEASPWEERAAAPLASAIRRRAAAAAADPDRLAAVPSSDRLTGTLVHRLFQRALDPSLDAAAVAAMVPSLARADELVDVANLPELAGRVAALYTAMRRRPEVASLLQGGQCRYEVPFSYAPPGCPDELIRGVIDCVVFDAEGGATVLELKTGQPRPDHDAQAALYRDALASALGTDRVDVRILYP